MSITFIYKDSKDNTERKLLIIPNANFAPNIGDTVLTNFKVIGRNWTRDGLVVFCS